METTIRQLAEATKNRDEARVRFDTARTATVRRDADEDLNFWQGKVAALTLTADGAVA